MPRRAGAARQAACEATAPAVCLLAKLAFAVRASDRSLPRITLAQAYDQHLNMILGEVEETITTVEIDDETYEEIIKVLRRHMQLAHVHVEVTSQQVSCSHLPHPSAAY